MENNNHKFISLSYELHLDNFENEIFEKVSAEKPLSFISGTGKMMSKFEDNLENKNKRDKFTFSLLPDDAYGNYRPQSVLDLNIEIFQTNGKLNTELIKIGNQVPMKDHEGHDLNGIVQKINDDTVTMDFNHPLAGKTLFFNVEILEIRDATKEELEETPHECTGCGKH